LNAKTPRRKRKLNFFDSFLAFLCWLKHYENIGKLASTFKVHESVMGKTLKLVLQITEAPLVEEFLQGNTTSKMTQVTNRLQKLNTITVRSTEIMD